MNGKKPDHEPDQGRYLRGRANGVDFWQQHICFLKKKRRTFQGHLNFLKMARVMIGLKVLEIRRRKNEVHKDHDYIERLVLKQYCFNLNIRAIIIVNKPFKYSLTLYIVRPRLEKSYFYDVLAWF